MTGQPASARIERLSAMEQACLRLVARRLSSRQIAAELGIAKTSVDTYCNRARAKLGVADRYEAARVMAAGLGAAGARDRAGPSPAARRNLALAACILAVPLAIVVLISGLRALDAMKPLKLHLAPDLRVSAH